MTGSSSNNVTALHNLLLYVTKGICAVTMELRFEKKSIPLSVNYLINDNLVMANPRVNMDADRICEQIAKTLEAKENLLKSVDQGRLEKLPEASVWNGSADEYEKKALVSGNDMTEDEDIRCLRQMIIYAVQGVAAYVRNAAILGKEDKDIDYFIQNSMKKVLDDHLNGGELIASILEAGRFGIRAMNLLGAAKKSTFGAPEITEVSTGVRSNPGILVAGDNFRDLEQLLKQAEAQGVDVYSYSDMLSAHAYPKLKTYGSFAGNYGNSWWSQKAEFEVFHGPILLTSDEMAEPRKTYIDRVYTTGVAGYPGCRHIPDAPEGQEKDFSEIIARAKECSAPKELRAGTLTVGYSREELLALGGKAAAAFRSKSLRKIVVMMGADSPKKANSYFTDFAKLLPEDTLILTAGSIKYRFINEDLGTVDNIPRILDAGSAADANDIMEFLIGLQNGMNINDLTLLPVYYNLAWDDPKSITIILNLLYLGLKNLHIGPTKLDFLSTGISEVLDGYFLLEGISDSPDTDIADSFGTRGDSVTTDMIVGDIVAQYPELVPVMLSMGLHCLGCGVSQMETLKEACEVHGLDPYDVVEVLNDELNHPADEDEDF